MAGRRPDDLLVHVMEQLPPDLQRKADIRIVAADAWLLGVELAFIFGEQHKWVTQVGADWRLSDEFVARLSALAP
jgi:hypothetical protein